MQVPKIVVIGEDRHIAYRKMIGDNIINKYQLDFYPYTDINISI